MRLDSVRELKQSLPAQLNKTFAVRAAAGKMAWLRISARFSNRTIRITRLLLSRIDQTIHRSA